MRTIEQMVQTEVLCCMSGLVATVAKGYCEAKGDLGELAEQAFELARPIDDYEEAAIEAGWQRDGSVWVHDDFADAEVSAEAAVVASGIEPHAREVYEHWAVTEWLAEKLREAGEKVDTDFAGLCVWARTTTGQAIHADSVIAKIYAETHRADA